MKKRMLSAAALAALVSSTTLGCGAQAPVTDSNGYADGTYTGDKVRIVFGDVQVQALIENGVLTDVTVLTYPTGHESDYINERAVPILEQEAIEAQSAEVDVVSGATLTSEAFMQSLDSALDQAR